MKAKKSIMDLPPMRECHIMDRLRMEAELDMAVRAGSFEQGRKPLKELIDYIYSATRESPDVVHHPDITRLRIAEIMGLMARTAVFAGAVPEEVATMVNDFQHVCLVSPDPFSLGDELMRQLHWLVDMVNRCSGQSVSNPVAKTLQYIWASYRFKPSLAEAAKLTGHNASYLSTRFRKETGLTFSAYVERLRMDLARRLLRETDLSILNVALESGFQSQQYFSRVFHSETGMTPKEYRNWTKHPSIASDGGVA